MKIGVDLLWVRPGICGGTESVIRNLLEGFGRYGRGNRYLLFVSEDNADSFFLHCMGDCFLADYLPSADSSSLRTAPSTYTYTLPLAFSPLMVTVYLPGVFGTMLKLLVGSRLPV